MDALDLHIEQRARVDVQPEALPDNPGEHHLVGALDRGQAILQRSIVGLVAETAQRRRVVQDDGTARLAQQPGQPRIGLMQPAAKRDAVSLVDDAVRIEPVQVLEHAGSHQLGMERRNAVDPV